MKSDSQVASPEGAKRRVLHVIDSLDLGGAQVVVENLVKYARDYAPEVVALHGPGVFSERLSRLGVPVQALSPRKWLPWYVPRLIAKVFGRRYDVVHCHLLAANLIAKPIAALLGTRVRINHDHCNDKASRSLLLRIADRRANALSTHIIAVSESTRRGLLNEGVPAGRVSTVFNGLDVETYRPCPGERAAARDHLALPADAWVVGGIGRLTYQKNFPLFVEVAAKVCARVPRAHFLIAGTGPDEVGLRQQIAALGLQEKVKLLGFVADPAALYPALDAMLLTSRYEGLPMTILEAMACGVPIVASDLDGMRDILTPDVHARLVPAGDAAGFADGLAELAACPEVAAQRAEVALGLVRERFSAEAMTRTVEGIYDRCLAG